jgi:hypothetical protein
MDHLPTIDCVIGGGAALAFLIGSWKIVQKVERERRKIGEERRSRRKGG